MILIVDFGSQTAHLIGRRLRQIGVVIQYCDPEDVLHAIKATKPKGIILSGGPNDISHDTSLSIDKQVLSLEIPVLGICYGWQLIAFLLGGSVKHSKKEYGPEEIIFDTQTGIFSFPEKKFSLIMSHGDTVTKLPKEFIAVGHTKQVAYAAIFNEKTNIFGVQFHPEADHTKHGMILLKNFAVDVCKEKLNPLELNPKTIIQSIGETVGNKKVICAVSGGVDSTVAAFLIGKSVGKQLIPVYVDSGLMRPETDIRVKYIFTKLIAANLIIVDAQKRFMNALKGITDPEIKRKTIGKLYIDIFQEQAIKYKEVAFLGQGTIYSDVIESKGSKHASHIKSHHNVGGLPKEMKLKLIEPLRELYKDEVREIGKHLGIPDNIANKQPFPGPGLAVRVLGEVTEERVKVLQEADLIWREEIEKAATAGKIKLPWQYFAVLLPVKTVGVL